MLNMAGQMPFEIAYKAPSRTLLKPISVTELETQHGNIHVPPAFRHELQNLGTRKLIMFWSQFATMKDSHDLQE